MATHGFIYHSIQGANGFLFMYLDTAFIYVKPIYLWVCQLFSNDKEHLRIPQLCSVCQTEQKLWRPQRAPPGNAPTPSPTSWCAGALTLTSAFWDTLRVPSRNQLGTILLIKKFISVIAILEISNIKTGWVCCVIFKNCWSRHGWLFLNFSEKKGEKIYHYSVGEQSTQQLEAEPANHHPISQL